MLKKLKLLSNIIFTLIALLMLIDYATVGKKETQQVVAIKSFFESYYNASGNSHYSKRIKTERFNFNVSDSYSELINVGDTIVIEASPIFKEINVSKIVKENYSETYSLRRVSGLFIPLLLLIAIVLNYKFKNKMLILLFVSKVILAADLLYIVL